MFNNLFNHVTTQNVIDFANENYNASIKKADQYSILTINENHKLTTIILPNNNTDSIENKNLICSAIKKLAELEKLSPVTIATDILRDSNDEMLFISGYVVNVNFDADALDEDDDFANITILSDGDIRTILWVYGDNLYKAEDSYFENKKIMVVIGNEDLIITEI